MAEIFTITSEAQDNSITFGTRQIGDSGLDILAVKVALGLIQSYPNLPNNSPTDPAVIQGPQWFDCLDNSPVPIEASAKFDKKLETALMRFQLDNQFTIINYLFSFYSVPNLIRAANLDLEDETVRKVIAGKQVDAAQKLFDNEFGKIGRATLSVLHGWLNRSEFSNNSFVHTFSVSTEPIRDVVPLQIWKNYVNQFYAQIPSVDSDIVQPDTPAMIFPNEDGSESDQSIEYYSPDTIEESEESEYQLYQWLTTVPYKKIAVTSRALARVQLGVLDSPIFQATEQVLQRVQQTNTSSRSTEEMTDQELVGFTNRALEPDPAIDPAPYELNSTEFLIYVPTEYKFDRNPPSDIADQEKREYEDAAIDKIIQFFDKPRAWVLNPENPLFHLAYPNVMENQLSPETSGLVSDEEWVLTTQAFINEEIRDDEARLAALQLYSVIDSDDQFATFRDFRTPSLRAGDVYKAAVIINREKLNLISSAAFAELEEDTPTPQTSQEVYDEVTEQVSDEFCVDTEDLDSEENVRRFKEYKAFAQVQKREILRRIRTATFEQAARGDTGNISVDLGVFGQARVNGATAFDALEGVGSLVRSAGGFASDTSPTGPAPRSITLTFAELEGLIEELVRLFEKSKDDEKLVTLNRPDFSLSLEATRLKKIPIVLKDLIKRKKSEDKTFLATYSDEKLFSTTLDSLGTRSTGHGRREIVDESPRYTFSDFSKAGTFVSINGNDLLLKAGPFNRPRTMNYLRNIKKMVNTTPFLTSTADCDLIDSIASNLPLILRYTKDVSIADKPDLFDPVHQWWEKEVSTPFDQWRSQPQESDFLSDISGLTVLGSAAALPILSDACDVAELRKKFYDRLSLPRLLCDALKCLKLPAVNIKIPKFDIPPPPKWPSFGLDDIKEFGEVLMDILAQIVKKILCAFANGILDILNTPFCNTKLEEQLFAGDLNDFSIPQKALADAFTDLGLPQTPEATEQTKELFEDLTNILTPSELCALLQGKEVSTEVYTIISRFAAERGVDFDSFRDKESIASFFDTLGIFLEDDVCESLGSFDQQLGTYTCEDTAALFRLLREKLLNNSVTAAEIDSALQAAERDLFDRAKALEVLGDPNATARLFPGTITPGAPGSPVSELPDSVKHSAEIVASSFLSPVKMSYLSSLRGFGNHFFMESDEISQPGDPNFDFKAKLTLEAATEKLRFYSNFISENPSVSLPSRDLPDLERLLDDMCQTFETRGSTFDPEMSVHVKQYRIFKGSNDIRTADYTTQEELNRQLRTYQSINNSEPVEFEVTLVKAGPNEQQKFPISLSRVLPGDIVQIDSQGTRDELGELDEIQTRSLKIGIVNKINQLLESVQQDVVNNLQKAVSTSINSELLKNLKQIFDSNAEAIREGGTNELISAATDSDETELVISDSASGIETKMVNLPSPPGFDKYKIQTRRVIQTTDGPVIDDSSDLSIQYCKRIPDLYADDLNMSIAKNRNFFTIFRDSFLNGYRVSEAELDAEGLTGFLNSQMSKLQGVVYDSVLEGLFEQLFFEFYDSSIFTEEYVERITRLVAGELYLEPKEGSSIPCVKNKYELNSDSDLGFDKLIAKDFVEEIMKEYARPENDVSVTDYAELTPVEKAMSNLVVKGLVRLTILEVALKSSINNSVFSFTDMISSESFRSYLEEICIKNIMELPTLQREDVKYKFSESLKKITGSSDPRKAIKTIINQEIFSIAGIIDRIFNKKPGGNLYDFYINNLQNLNIPSDKVQNKWVVDPQLEMPSINPSIYFENYVKINGPLANPDTFSTPVSFRRATEQFTAIAPGVYDRLNLEPPNISYLSNYTNDINSSNVSFLNDSSEDVEIISIEDFQKLIDIVTGGDDGESQRAERDIKRLFQEGNLSGRPTFLKRTPSAAYEIKTNKRQMHKHTDIASDDSGLPLVTTTYSIGSTSQLTNDGLRHYSTFVDGTTFLDDQLNEQNKPRPFSANAFDDYTKDNAFVRSMSKDEFGLNLIESRGRPRGVTRRLLLDKSGDLPSTYPERILQDGDLKFIEPTYGRTDKTTFDSYPDGLKVKVEQEVLDFIGEESPIFNQIGEIKFGYTDADWSTSRLEIPSDYREKMTQLQEIMRVDDPNVDSASRLPFRFGGDTGCFVEGRFGFVHSRQEAPYTTSERTGEEAFRSYAKDSFVHTIVGDGSIELPRHSQPDVFGTDSVTLQMLGPDPILYDNDYKIPTRILLTRYNVFGFTDSTASECYVNFIIPECLEDQSNSRNTQLVFDAWNEIVETYFEGILNTLRAWTRSIRRYQSNIPEMLEVLQNAPEISRANIVECYRYVKNNISSFPVFYDRYRYSRGNSYSFSSSDRRPSFFSKEKLLKKVCDKDIAREDSIFSNTETINQFVNNRGILLKTLKGEGYAGSLYFNGLERLRETNFAEFTETINSLLGWFNQRREDSLWGRTYTSRISNSQYNPRVETPDIICSTSPFYADGRTSVDEFSLVLSSLFANLQMMADPRPVDTGDLQRVISLQDQKREEVDDFINTWLALSAGRLSRTYMLRNVGVFSRIDLEAVERDMEEKLNFTISQPLQQRDVESFSRMSRYAIANGESREMPDSPMHNLVALGLGPDSSPLFHRSFFRDAEDIYDVSSQESMIMFALTVANSTRQIDRMAAIFSRMIAANQFSATLESHYHRALEEVGIAELWRSMNRTLTDDSFSADFIFDRYFFNSKISQGVRMVLAIPDESDASLGLSVHRGSSPSLDIALEEQRLGDVRTIDGRNLETYFLANFEEEIDLSDPCWNTTNIPQLITRFRDQSQYRLNRLQEEERFQIYFDYLFPLERMVSTAAIYNTSLLGAYNTFPLLFASAKNMLGTMFYQASKRSGAKFEDTTLQDLGIGTLDGSDIFDLTAKNAAPGDKEDCDLFPVDFGQWAKMLQDMLEEFIKFIPSMILRGIAEQIDPAYKEIKHHWNSCHMDGFSFVGKKRDGRGQVLTAYTGDREVPLGLRGGRDREGSSTYAGVFPTFPVDLVVGVGSLIQPFPTPRDIEFGLRTIAASLDKLVTYIYSGPLPLLDPSYAFQIPCIEPGREGDSAFNWDKFELGLHGRYGHPITPITLLALSTPVMRRDVKDQRFKCQVLNDTTNQAKTKDDLEEC